MSKRSRKEPLKLEILIFMTQAGCKQNLRLAIGELVFVHSPILHFQLISSRVACRPMISDVLNNTNEKRSEVDSVAATEAWVEKDLQLSSNPEFQRNWDQAMCEALYSQLEITLNQHKLAFLVSAS